MARTIWLLRHGDAEPHGSKPDFDRALTARGEREAHAAGRALARLGVRFDSVFTSPRVRALDTATLACAELRLRPHVHDPLAGGFDHERAAELLAGTRGDATVLLVGHEPDLSRLVGDLTGARVEMRKGSIAAIRGRELIGLLGPREIELVAGR